MELCHFSFFFGTSMENTFPFPSPRKDSCFQLEQPPPVTESMNCGTKPRPKVHRYGSVVGEGNGTPLQCSCLENPRDRGAWWTAVYGVTQSWTRLKRLSSSSSSSSRALRKGTQLNVAIFVFFFPLVVAVTKSNSLRKSLPLLSSEYIHSIKWLHPVQWQLI